MVRQGFDRRQAGAHMEIATIAKTSTAMLLEYWNQPNAKQLNIRIPPAARRMIERLAKRKPVEVSTLVRMWSPKACAAEVSQPDRLNYFFNPAAQLIATVI